MKPARAFLQVVLSVFLLAALVVSSGFAATKKLDRHRLASEDWNDSPLMSATLLSTGSSVPSDGASIPVDRFARIPLSHPQPWHA